MPTSFAIAYPIAGYQGTPGQPNPLDVCMYYLMTNPTTDWGNASVALALSPAHVMAMFGAHSWVDGEHIKWAYDKTFGQQLSMQELYDRHGRTPLPEHPVYSNAQLTNILGFPQLSLIIDPTQGDPHRVPDGVWYKMLNGGNNNGWPLVVQDDETKWVADWPPKDYREV